MRIRHRVQIVGALLLLAMALTGCQQPAEPTARVTLGPPPPPTIEHTATPEVATAVIPTPSPASATTVPTSTPTPQRPEQGIALTVLHTNDVNGYIDPCG